MVVRVKGIFGRFRHVFKFTVFFRVSKVPRECQCRTPQGNRHGHPDRRRENADWLRESEDRFSHGDGLLQSAPGFLLRLQLEGERGELSSRHLSHHPPPPPPLENMARHFVYVYLAQNSSIPESQLPENQCGSDGTSSADLPLRIAAIFIILVGSLGGALFPVLARRSKSLSKRLPKKTFETAKYFGSGVIVSNALSALC